MKKLMKGSPSMKKTVCLLICMIVLLGCNPFPNEIHSEYGRNGYTKSELVDLFHSHKEEFLQVAEIVLNSASFQEKLENSKEGQASIWTYSSNHSFTESEWNSITQLFTETGVQTINKNKKGGKDTIRYFFRQDQDGKSFELIYCDSDNASNLYYQRGYCCFFEKLDDHWWIGCRDYHNTEYLVFDKANGKSYRRVLDFVLEYDQSLIKLCDKITACRTDEIDEIQIDASTITSIYNNNAQITEPVGEQIGQVFREYAKLKRILADESGIRFCFDIDTGTEAGLCFKPEDTLCIEDLYDNFLPDKTKTYNNGAVIYEKENDTSYVFLYKILPQFYYYEIYQY